MTLSVTVAGGGVGGLTAALALRQAGVDVRVFERQPSATWSGTGSGLTLWSNATRVLGDLGLLDQLVDVGSPLSWFENRTSDGHQLSRWPIAEFGLRAGAPSISISRGELHRILGKAVDGLVSTGNTITAFEQTEHSVDVQLATGATERSDVLVGADGLRSRVRQHLSPDEAPRFAGYVVYRAVVAQSLDRVPPGRFVQIWGRGQRFGFYRLGRGLTYWFSVQHARRPGPSPGASVKEWLQERHASWEPAVVELLEASTDGDISCVRIYDRPPRRLWGTGRVTLLGDAIHPMTFNVGQGACQAIEDASVLATQLGGARSTPVDALRRYEDIRRQPTAQLVRRARRIGALGQLRSPVACTLRDAGLKVLLGTPGRKQQERLLTGGARGRA